MTKQCRECAEVKSVDEFYRSHRGVKGQQFYQSYCKPCFLERNRRQYRATNPPKQKPERTEKRCARCGEIKPVQEFMVTGKSKAGRPFYGWCGPCNNAYHVERRYPTTKRAVADALLKQGLRFCRRCKKARPVEEFRRVRLTKQGKPVLRWCLECEHDAARGYHHRHGEKYRPRMRSASRLRLYGLTPEDFERIVTAQEGRCAVCGREVELCVDHNHRTGKLRDLLCRRCNTALGQVDDSIEILSRLISYLQRHQQAQESASLISPLLRSTRGAPDSTS